MDVYQIYVVRVGEGHLGGWKERLFWSFEWCVVRSSWQEDGFRYVEEVGEVLYVQCSIGSQASIYILQLSEGTGSLSY